MQINLSNIFNLSSVIHSSFLLVASNLLILITMSLVYFLGKDSVLSDILIYGPISAIIVVLIRDKFTFSFVFSCILALLHGLAHKFYPFLDEVIGVNTSIEVWQDQLIHLGQAILFSSLYYDFSDSFLRKTFEILISGNIINVILGFFCWGEWCHNYYVWVSLLPALASGLHFATGALYHTPLNVATCGFILQGISSISTYFLFKSSDDILKLFALCRFFEIYFIIPHYIGYFYSRYVITKVASNDNSKINTFLQIIGVYSISLIVKLIPHLNNYFFVTSKLN